MHSFNVKLCTLPCPWPWWGEERKEREGAEGGKKGGEGERGESGHHLLKTAFRLKATLNDKYFINAGSTGDAGWQHLSAVWSAVLGQLGSVKLLLPLWNSVKDPCLKEVFSFQPYTMLSVVFRNTQQQGQARTIRQPGRTDYRQVTDHKPKTDGKHRKRQRIGIWAHSWSKAPQKEFSVSPIPHVTSTM